MDKARKSAAEKAEKPEDTQLTASIRAIILRDMRKRASDLTETDEQASELLQPSSAALTKKTQN